MGCNRSGTSRSYMQVGVVVNSSGDLNAAAHMRRALLFGVLTVGNFKVNSLEVGSFHTVAIKVVGVVWELYRGH